MDGEAEDGSGDRDHLNEVCVRVLGKRAYLWRAVDDENEVLEVFAQSRRNKCAALKLMRKFLKRRATSLTASSPTSWVNIPRSFASLV
uniref:DDE-type integrase/transposase/recombinase n=1 Tax=Roseovarius indicus TaxID=540747 RepID=UPI003B51A590